VPVSHSRFIRSPAEAYFAVVDHRGEVDDSEFPVAQLDTDIFDFFEAYADLVGRQDQIVASVFELSELPGGLEGLDSFVYFQQTIVMLYHISNYAPYENKRAVGLIERKKVSYPLSGWSFTGCIV